MILSLFIATCSDSNDPVKEETRGWSVQQLYASASTALAKKNYDRAIKLYSALESTYPYGVYAQQGLLDIAYAYYQNNQPELALPMIEEFIKTYPTNTNMDYAFYLKGYINYKNDNGLLSSFTGQDLAERDPKGAEEAFAAFTQLVNNYPNSRFTPDAKDKINRLVNALARSELYKARFYMSINAYLGAIGRSQNLITKYPNTQQVEEALAIQITAYKKLGKDTLSNSVQKVLVLNFPQSDYINHEWVDNDIPWYAFWR